MICHKYLSDKPVDQETELNWTKLIYEAINLEHIKCPQMGYQSKDYKLDSEYISVIISMPT